MEPLTIEEELALIDRAKAGDRQAIERLHRQYEGLVKHFAVRIARFYRCRQFEDMLQEGMMAILRAIRTFDPEKQSKPSAHIARWTRSLMADFCRAEIRHREREGGTGLGLWLHRIPAKRASCELETREELGRAIPMIPPRRRQIALMHYLDGLTREEISSQLGIKTVTVNEALLRPCDAGEKLAVLA